VDDLVARLLGLGRSVSSVIQPLNHGLQGVPQPPDYGFAVLSLPGAPQNITKRLAQRLEFVADILPARTPRRRPLQVLE